jgi:hypothetical protein
MFTMLPERRSVMCPPIAAVIRQAPERSTSSMSCHSSSVISWATLPDGAAMPALLTSTSTPPKRSIARPATAVRAARSRTSASAVSTAAPCLAQRSAVCSSCPAVPSA